MMLTDDLRDRDCRGLLILCQVTAQDITFLKMVQGALTCVVLLVLAAIIGALNVAGAMNIGNAGRLSLCVVAALVGLMATYGLCRLNSAVDEREQRLARIFVGLATWTAQENGPQRKVGACHVFKVLCGLLILGLGLFWWVVLTGWHALA